MSGVAAICSGGVKILQPLRLSLGGAKAPPRESPAAACAGGLPAGHLNHYFNSGVLTISDLENKFGGY